MENGKSRKELYQAAPDNIKALYAGEETGEMLWKVAKEFGIPDGNSYREFALGIGDVILGSYQKTTLPQILKDRLHWDDHRIKLVTNALQPLLDKIPEQSSPQPVESISTPPLLTNTEEESEAESTGVQSKNNQLRSLRTFADDVAFSRAHSYGSFKSADNNDHDDDTPTYHSSQDDIIKK